MALLAQSRPIGRAAVARPGLRRCSKLMCRSDADASPPHKKAAAKLFVDTYVKSGSVLGLGSGEIVHLTIDEVGKRLASGALESVAAVTSCSTAAYAAAYNGIPQTTYEEAGKIDVGFEEVGMMDLKANAAIFGVGQEPHQPQILMSRYVMSKADKLVVLVNSEDLVDRLGGVLPVVVSGDTWEVTGEELDDIFIGDAELWRRSNSDRTNPRGGDDPYISPEGHNIIDIRFIDSLKLFGNEEAYEKILKEIRSVDGVYSYGMLLGEAHAAVIAKEDSDPVIVELKKNP